MVAHLVSQQLVLPRELHLLIEVRHLVEVRNLTEHGLELVDLLLLDARQLFVVGALRGLHEGEQCRGRGGVSFQLEERTAVEDGGHVATATVGSAHSLCLGGRRYLEGILSLGNRVDLLVVGVLVLLLWV